METFTSINCGILKGLSVQELCFWRTFFIVTNSLVAWVAMNILGSNFFNCFEACTQSYVVCTPLRARTIAWTASCARNTVVNHYDWGGGCARITHSASSATLSTSCSKYCVIGNLVRAQMCWHRAALVPVHDGHRHRSVVFLYRARLPPSPAVPHPRVLPVIAAATTHASASAHCRRRSSCLPLLVKRQDINV